MIVTPIAHTVLADMPQSVRATNFDNRIWSDLDANTSDIDLLAEFAGRACYQAWKLPNPATSSNEGYLHNIIRQQHFSVLEHGSVTFYVEGVSRSLTHELIRHRHLSYSELSQRYVNMAEANFVVPPALKQHARAGRLFAQDANVKVKQALPRAVELYEDAVRFLEERGVEGKKAREAARAFMPAATETKIVVTGNLRAWRDMLFKRWHVTADAEIREFAGMVLDHLRDLAPYSVQDISEAPFQ